MIQTLQKNNDDQYEKLQGLQESMSQLQERNV